jgi:hypothetical protein
MSELASYEDYETRWKILGRICIYNLTLESYHIDSMSKEEADVDQRLACSTDMFSFERQLLYMKIFSRRSR